MFYLKSDTSTVDKICNELFDNSREVYAEEEYEDGQLVYKPPPLEEVWLDEPDRRNRHEELEQQQRRQEEREHSRNQQVLDIITANDKEDPPPFGVEISDDEESVVDDSLPQDVTESEGGDVGDGGDVEPENDSPSPPLAVSPPSAPEGDSLAPEGAPRCPQKVYPPASRHRDGGGLRSRDKLKDPRRHLDLAMTLTHGEKFEPVRSSQLRKSHKRQKYRQRMRERREKGDA